MKKIKAVGWIWKQSFPDSKPYFDFGTLSCSKWACEHMARGFYTNAKAFRMSAMKGKAVKVRVIEVK